MAYLYDLAKVLRSKNSGPFEITIDILFDSLESYTLFKNSNIVTKDRICELYKVSIEEIHELVFFDQALGCKITIARSVSSGTVGDRDVYGAQQHAPLMNLEINEERVRT